MEMTPEGMPVRFLVDRKDLEEFARTLLEQGVKSGSKYWIEGTLYHPLLPKPSGIIGATEDITRIIFEVER